MNNSLLHLGSMNFDLIKTIYNLNTRVGGYFENESKVSYRYMKGLYLLYL